MLINQLQAMMDAVTDAVRETRKDYHLTLGGLIDFLESHKGSGKMVMYEGECTSPGEPMSYRGHYADLSFEDSQDVRTVDEVLQDCQKSLLAVFDGYKGGHFTMGADAPLWRSEYGTASGLAIIQTKVSDDEDLVLLVTRQVDA